MKLTFAAIIVANVLDGLPDDTLVVDLGLGRDLSGDHDHPRLGHGLACNLQKYIAVRNQKSSKSVNSNHTLQSGSCLRWASRTASEIWSHILSAI